MQLYSAVQYTHAQHTHLCVTYIFSENREWSGTAWMPVKPVIPRKVHWRSASDTHSGIVSALFRLISLPAVALPRCNLRGTHTKSVKSTGMTWDPVQLKQDTLAATALNSLVLNNREQLSSWFEVTVFVVKCYCVFQCCFLKEMAAVCFVCWSTLRQLTRSWILCARFLEVPRIKLLTPWIWTRSRKDSKQPCQSFNPR